MSFVKEQLFLQKLKRINFLIFLSAFGVVLLLFFLLYTETSIYYSPYLYLISGVLALVFWKKEFSPFWGMLFLLCLFVARYAEMTYLGADHLGFYLKHSGAQALFEGVIDKEREVREGKINLTVKVEKLAFYKKGEPLNWIPLEKGKILVSIFPETGKLYERLDFGQRVFFQGKVILPQSAANPGGFDYRKYLRNIGVYGLVSIKKGSDIKILEENVAYLFSSNSFPWSVFNQWYRKLFIFSLDIKKHFLSVIKKTVPYPESAFLGGVQLGLKSGLDAEVQDQFRRSGVSHVLAVSGLHVTIITVLFVLLCQIFRLKKVIYVPLVMGALLIFSIITGLRPSTVRAALMNSLSLAFILLTDYMVGEEVSLKYSINLGVSVALLVVLFFNPLLLFEPGFTLSFGAILSLSILTTPIEVFLTKYLQGKNMYLFSAMVGGYFFFSLYFPAFIAAYWFLTFPVFIALIYFTRPQKFNFFVYGYKDFHPFLKSFIGAQFAILFGMMFPLSSFYFHQISLASPFANLLAIPLIGVIVQLGMLASLISFIPVIGMKIALLLNAGNYLFIKFFLWMASVFSLIAYPYAPRYSGMFYLFYYLMLLTFAYWPSLQELGRKLVVFWKENRFGVQRYWRWIGSLTIVIILLAVYGYMQIRNKYEDKLIFPVLKSFSSVGMLNAKKVVFLNAGDEKILWQRDKEKLSYFNDGERELSQILLGLGKSRVDYFIITSLAPENWKALPFWLEKFLQPEKIYLPPAFSKMVNKNISFSQFSLAFSKVKTHSFYEAYLVWKRILSFSGVELEIVNKKRDLKLSSEVKVEIFPLTTTQLGVRFFLQGKKYLFLESGKISNFGSAVQDDDILVLGKNFLSLNRYSFLKWLKNYKRKEIYFVGNRKLYLGDRKIRNLIKKMNKLGIKVFTNWEKSLILE